MGKEPEIRQELYITHPVVTNLRTVKHVEQILSVINITSDIKLVSNSSTKDGVYEPGNTSIFL